MKPRFRKINGLWYCANYDAATKTWHRPKGYGYTPAEAWVDWKVKR